MSREVVYFEGVPSPSGLTVAPKALTLEGPQVPVIMGGEFQHTVGTGREMEVNSEGGVSFELDCWGYTLDMFEIGVYVQPVNVAPDDHALVVNGIIRAVTLTPKLAYQGRRLDT
jgi:hypothetical protein